MTLEWEAAGTSHVGRVRRGNEDAFRIDPEGGVFLVADGMGGHAAGEVASRLAADAALTVFGRAPSGAGAATGDVIAEAFSEASRRICEHSLSDDATAGMGTTLTVAVVSRSGVLHVGHVGDCRAYRLHDGVLQQLTRDHTWVQQEVDAGRVAARAARNHPLGHILSRVISTDQPPEVDIFAGPVVPGDLILLCSDGLHGLVNGPRLRDLLAAGAALEEILEQLVRAANRRGGKDNITAVLVRILPVAEPPSETVAARNEEGRDVS